MLTHEGQPLDPTAKAFAVARRWRSEIVTGAPSDTLVRRGWGLGLSRLRITFPHCNALCCLHAPVSQMLVPSARWCAGAGHDPAPDPRYPPWRGRGRQPCTGLQFVLPLVRKSPVSRLSRCVIGARTLPGRAVDTVVGRGECRCMIQVNSCILPMSVACVPA